MVVLQHRHSLSLIDLNPYEEVYEDKEDLIGKQEFHYSCNWCNQEITYVHRYYYKCDQCDYSLHKLCKQLPTKLEHASHSVHTLTLFLDNSQGHCHMCRHIPQYKQLRYDCSRCKFNICLYCAMVDVPHHTIYHPSHQHPLISVCKERQILAECDAYGKKHEAVFYECSTCFRSLIHKDCVFMPKRLQLKEGIHGRFSHSHPLILAYSFPKEDQEAKYNPTCRICDKSFSNSEKLWLYKCDTCRYYAHMDCARLINTSKSSHSGSGVVATSAVLHLPFHEQTYNILTDLFYEECTNYAKRITHMSHEHSLELQEYSPDKFIDELCDVCVKPITHMPYYKCDTDTCSFIIHELCSRLRVVLRDYICHPQHILRLVREVPNNDFHVPIFYCSVCSFMRSGFAYSCESCEYYVDVWGALIPRYINHKSHHDLLLKTHKRLNKSYCRMCLSGFAYPKETSLSCNECSFHLHLGCAFFLLETSRHKYDKHPMYLTYGPTENHVGDYFCEVCEEELNPNVCFYHCHECAQSMHTACAPILKRQRKPIILYGSSWEPDEYNIYKTLHKTPDHQHSLKLFQMRRRGLRLTCQKCRMLIKYRYSYLDCNKCLFTIHVRCPPAPKPHGGYRYLPYGLDTELLIPYWNDESVRFI